MSLPIRCLLLAVAFTVHSGAHAQNSMLRVVCSGEDVGAEVSVNGKFKGACPVDMLVEPGTLKLRVEKKVGDLGERVFESEIRMGEGVAKKVEAILTMHLNAEGQKREAERLAEAARMEQGLWQQAQAAETPPAVQAYLDKFPKGTHAAAAHEKLALIRKKAETEKPGTVFKDCADCPEMVVIPPGSFMMGSPSEEKGRSSNEGPQHRVTIGRAFSVGKFELTFDEWDACTRDNGCTHRPTDNGWGRGRSPVFDISWNDSKQYVEWLSRKTGKVYRLLTEAEWEYAARAGTTTAYYWGDSDADICQHADAVVRAAGFSGAFWGTMACLADRTSLVGERRPSRPNAFGLYDMLGNVWERTEDCWNENYNGAPTDGSAWTTGDCSQRAVRSGAWVSLPDGLRAASRSENTVSVRWVNVGLRVARTN